MLKEFPTHLHQLSFMSLCKDAFYYCECQRDLSVHLLIVAKQYMKETGVSIYPPTLSSYCLGLVTHIVKDRLTGF